MPNPFEPKDFVMDVPTLLLQDPAFHAIADGMLTRGTILKINRGVLDREDALKEWVLKKLNEGNFHPVDSFQGRRITIISPELAAQNKGWPLILEAGTGGRFDTSRYRTEGLLIQKGATTIGLDQFHNYYRMDDSEHKPYVMRQGADLSFNIGSYEIPPEGLKLEKTRVDMMFERMLGDEKEHPKLKEKLETNPETMKQFQDFMKKVEGDAKLHTKAQDFLNSIGKAGAVGKGAAPGGWPSKDSMSTEPDAEQETPDSSKPSKPLEEMTTEELMKELERRKKAKEAEDEKKRLELIEKIKALESSDTSKQLSDEELKKLGAGQAFPVADVGEKPGGKAPSSFPMQPAGPGAGKA